MYDIVGVNTMNNRFEYFLNAVHYWMWLDMVRLSRYTDRILGILVGTLGDMLLSPSRKEQWKNHLKTMSDQNLRLKAIDDSGGIWSDHNIVCVCWSYVLFPISIIVGIWLKVVGNFSLGMMSVFPITFILVDIYLHRVLFSKSRYKVYFRQFERRSEAWHVRWRRITRIFIAGGVLSLIVGFLAMFAIVAL